MRVKLLEKWQGMSLYRRALLMILAIMIAGFGAATAVAGGQKGIKYRGAFLRLSEEGGLRKYSGKVDGTRAEFTVDPDGTIAYRWGDCGYGPYQIVEDLTAVPKGLSGSPGVEIRREDEVLFRGAYFEGSSLWTLVDEEGELRHEWGLIGMGTSSGTTWYQNGRAVDEYEAHEPALSDLLRVGLGTKLTHRGSLGLYLLVTLLAVLDIFMICFPRRLFYYRLSWTVQDPYGAEPSDWYIFWEKAGWAAFAAASAWLYWMALTVID